MNHSFLQWMSNIAHEVRADKLIGRKYGGAGAIFMGHSVVKSQIDTIDGHLQISAWFLERVLQFYIANDIDIISLDDAIERLATNNTRKFVCFTFDDGYRDNLTLALPLFKKYNKPFTVYITTAFLERRYDYWWGPVREAIRRHDEASFEIAGRRFTTSTLQQKTEAFQNVFQAITNGEMDIEEANLFWRAKGIDNEQVLEADALTPDELKTLSKDPLVEIGGHTDGHQRLARLSLDDARADILKNKTYLEGLTGKKVRHFAYPYGGANSCGEREFGLCRELGFRTATTTRWGGLFPDHLRHLTGLPRLRFLGTCASMGFMECQRNGLVTALKLRFGNPVVSL